MLRHCFVTALPKPLKRFVGGCVKSRSLGTFWHFVVVSSRDKCKCFHRYVCGCGGESVSQTETGTERHKRDRDAATVVELVLRRHLFDHRASSVIIISLALQQKFYDVFYSGSSGKTDILPVPHCLLC